MTPANPSTPPVPPIPPVPPPVTPDDADADLYCPDCGYNLRGIASARCPECGRALDRAALLRSRLPWPQRAAIGRIRAYLSTVRLVIADPRALGDEVVRPVRLADARRFRHITVLIALIGPAALITWAYFTMMRVPGAWFTPQLLGFSSTRLAAGAPPPYAALGWALELLAVPLAWLGLWLFLLACSGVASYWFHPPHLPIVRQNRAVALSYYACAPLALTPLTILSVALILFMLGNGWFERQSMLLPLALVGVACCIVPVVQLLSGFTAPLRLLRRATLCSRARVWLAAAALPLLWALFAALFAVGIPLAYLWVALVILSVVA